MHVLSVQGSNYGIAWRKSGGNEPFLNTSIEQASLSANAAIIDKGSAVVNCESVDADIRKMITGTCDSLDD